MARKVLDEQCEKERMPVGAEGTRGSLGEAIGEEGSGEVVGRVEGDLGVSEDEGCGARVDGVDFGSSCGSFRVSGW